MTKKLKRITYNELNARQQENYNFQKISAVLADYGFVTMRLTDDWQGADFIAQHIDGESFMKVQLKGRLTVEKKYIGKDIQIAFQDNGTWYLFPHDELLEKVLIETNIINTESWSVRGGYSFPYLSGKLKLLLAAYKIYPFDIVSLASATDDQKDVVL
jgi:hypothetical protein